MKIKDIVENMTAGGTGAGSIASVSAPLGEPVRRGKAPKKKRKKTPEAYPDDFDSKKFDKTIGSSDRGRVGTPQDMIDDAERLVQEYDLTGHVAEDLENIVDEIAGELKMNYDSDTWWQAADTDLYKIIGQMVSRKMAGKSHG